MAMAGFKDDSEVRRAIAFSMLYPGSRLNDSSWDVGVKGMKSWQASISPVTQYDAIPRRGESACTFIAGVCALTCVWRSVVPTPAEWSLSIRTGVDAFYLCKDAPLKKKSATADKSQHKSIVEVLPYIFRAMGLKESMLESCGDIFSESVVGLQVPRHLQPDEYHVFLGPNAWPELGSDGLVSALDNIFTTSSRMSAKSSTGDLSRGVVVTRPPETYCICRGQDGGNIFFRDSHRKRQYDFDGVASLLEWIKKEKSYFVPQPESPDLHNMVGLYTVVPTAASGIMIATNPHAFASKSPADDIGIDPNLVRMSSV
jgi:hypothetical protein